MLVTAKERAGEGGIFSPCKMKGLWSQHFPAAAAEKPPELVTAEERAEEGDTFSTCKMKGLWSQHFPAAAAEKPAELVTVKESAEEGDTFSPCKMKGLSSQHFPAAAAEKPAAPLARYQRCFLCPMCNAASCRLLTSKTTKNPGRQFYTCPANDRNFFKWADEVKPDELIDVPYCGGCAAGVCRVRREKSGPNAGRILFTCGVKEGEGSCGYRVWQDELEMSATGRADERISSFQPSTINFDDTSTTNTNLVEDGKQSDEEAADSVSPFARYQRCFICPTCNAASCRLLMSNTPKNPGRQFYKCPAHDHNFFKWADEVKPDELIDVPYCGGCAAGVCRVRREKSGPNAGRILFTCRVKEGEGSCGYRVWQDELERSATGRADDKISSFQSSTINFDDTSATNTNLVEEGKQSDEEGVDSVSPMIDTSVHLQGHGVTSGKMVQLKCQEDKPNESPKRPHKRSRYGDVKASDSLFPARSLTIRLAMNSVSIKNSWMADAIRQNLSTQLHGWWGRLAFHPMPCLMTYALKPSTYYFSSHFVVQDKILVYTIDLTTLTRSIGGVEIYNKPLFNLGRYQNALDSTPVVQDKILVNSDDSTTLTKSLLGAESYSKPLFTSGQCHNAELSGITPFRAALDVPSCSDPFNGIIHNIMSKSISNAFCQAAECLQNDLLTLLETMDVKDHEAMSQAAKATFVALDRLLFDHQDFKKRAKELIHCASSLAEIEQSMPRNDSYQKLVEYCSSERTRLDEIKCVHANAIDAVTNNKKHLKVLQEEISSTMDWLFQIEAKVSSCEVEIRNMEHQLDQISKDKEALEGKYLIASKELEESQKLLELKEAERNAAKAAFDRARALLRG